MRLNLFKTLPKIDLHRHLEGSLRVETLWEFHQSQRQGLHANRDALERAYTVVTGERPGFLPFLAKFAAIYFRFGKLQEIERIGREAVADAADDGVIHVELRFSPVGFARRILFDWNTIPSPKTDPKLVADVAAALISGAQAEAARRGISVAFIITLGRHFGLEVNRPAAELLQTPIGAQLAGLDLAGDEAAPAAEYIPFFKEWKQAGRGVTIHAGEDLRPICGPKNIREAFCELNADRIGHGIRAIEDPLLLDELRQRGTVLEVCLTSNVQTQSVATYESHPLKQLLAAGVRVTINSDDPTLSRLVLSDEFYVAQQYCGLSFNDLKNCTLTAAVAAYVSPTQKEFLKSRILSEWNAVECF